MEVMKYVLKTWLKGRQESAAGIVTAEEPDCASASGESAAGTGEESVASWAAGGVVCRRRVLVFVLAGRRWVVCTQQMGVACLGATADSKPASKRKVVTFFILLASVRGEGEDEEEKTGSTAVKEADSMNKEIPALTFYAVSWTTYREPDERYQQSSRLPSAFLSSTHVDEDKTKSGMSPLKSALAHEECPE
ncbi:hypothetical protein LTR56_002513 [Elasticomyces elasticus]|nr:hypothetical protein LTR56_002513 [Elasticomyces elasticus]